ncbi:MAG TPA: hypothetical protein VG028_19060 [Terriglobia bacterium]|nr:hypothetical protein [Terriglobia bacterium]
MIPAYRAITLEAANAMFVSLAMGYMVLVILGYATEGSHYQFRLDAHHPILTLKRLLVGLGVRLVGWTLRGAQLLLDPLFEASAEVGDWFADHTSPETRSRIRSRFI